MDWAEEDHPRDENGRFSGDPANIISKQLHVKNYAANVKWHEEAIATTSKWDKAAIAKHSKAIVKWKEKAQKYQKELAAVGLPYKLSQLGHIPDNRVTTGKSPEVREWARNLARAQGYVK